MIFRSLIVLLAIMGFSFQVPTIKEHPNNCRDWHGPDSFINLWDRLFYFCPAEVDRMFEENIGIGYLQFREWYINLADEEFHKYFEENVVFCSSLQ